MTTYVIAAVGALLFVAVIWGFALLSAKQRVAPGAVVPPARRKSGLSLFAAAGDLLGRPLTGPALRLLAPWRTRIRRRIDAAGRPYGMTVTSYARQTAGYMVLFGSVCLLLIALGKILVGLLALLGVLQTELLLYARARARQDEIQRTMPDFLDVLAVTVSAGLGFRHSVARVSESMPGALAEEFLVALRQMELGTPRRTAFEELRARNDSEALAQFVTAILQAEELGAPLSAALTDIARDMRRHSAQYAKRRAQRTTPRITLVSLTLAMPALMLLILGALFFSAVGGGGFGGLLGG
ncbi:MAG TPA: type II secretion system F family protein [Streptosporangiaceae bacterium]|jgi:tight adherence protein C